MDVKRYDDVVALKLQYAGNRWEYIIDVGTHSSIRGTVSRVVVPKDAKCRVELGPYADINVTPRTQKLKLAIIDNDAMLYISVDDSKIEKFLDLWGKDWR